MTETVERSLLAITVYPTGLSKETREKEKCGREGRGEEKRRQERREKVVRGGGRGSRTEDWSRRVE